MVARTFSVPLIGPQFNFDDVNILLLMREMKGLEAKVSSAQKSWVSSEWMASARQ